MTVKIIPITPEYREGWEATFRQCKHEWCEENMTCRKCGKGRAEIMDTAMVWAENG